MDNKFNYVCSECGKEFSRGKAFLEDEDVLCHGCSIKKYYRENPGKSAERYEKTKATNLKKYGNTNVAKNEDIKKKISNNLLDAYSDRGDEIKNKRVSTNREKFGVDYPAQDPDIQSRGMEVQKSRQGYIGWENKELQKDAEIKAHSEESNKKRKETSIKNYGVESVVSSEGNSNRLKGYLYEGIRFDSGWELALYIWYKDHCMSAIYHPKYYIEYEDENGKEHIYWPDFLVNGQFIETKGDQFFNDKDEPFNKYTRTFWWNKYNALTKNNVKIMRKEDMIPYVKYVNDTYGKGYLKSFKVKPE